MPWAWSSSVVLTHAQLKKLSCGKDRSDLDGKPIFKVGGTLSWLYSLGFKSRLNKIVLAIPNLSLPGFYFHWSFHPHMPLFNKLLHLLEGWTCAFLWMPASQPASLWRPAWCPLREWCHSGYKFSCLFSLSFWYIRTECSCLCPSSPAFDAMEGYEQVHYNLINQPVNLHALYCGSVWAASVPLWQLLGTQSCNY